MAAATSLALRAPGVRSAPGEGSVLWCKQVQLTEEHLKKGATSSRPSLFCGDKPGSGEELSRKFGIGMIVCQVIPGGGKTVTIVVTR